MNFNKIRNLKHKELWLRYQENKTILSTSYANYINRILRYWQTKEDAIKIANNIKKPNAIKTMVDQNWRECTICRIYKDRWSYHNSKSWVYRKTNDCKECRNKKRQEYREKTNRIKDREYKKKTRTLEIWSTIALFNPIWINWVPREDKYKVLSYKKYKWYLLKSLHTWEETYKSISDNKHSIIRRYYTIKEENEVKEKEVRDLQEYFSHIPC